MCKYAIYIQTDRETHRQAQCLNEYIHLYMNRSVNHLYSPKKAKLLIYGYLFNNFLGFLWKQ